MINQIQKAVQAIKDGKLVIFPTETVYGIGADATNEKAVRSIYSAKNRPTQNPLIVHCASLEKAKELAFFHEDAIKLAQQFWPGSITLILSKNKHADLATDVTAGLETVGIRVPYHPTAQKFLRAVDRPIAAPSANISGQVSATQTRHIKEALSSHVHCVLEGGRSQVGIESTIIDLSIYPYVIRRLGKITYQEVERILPNKIIKTHIHKEKNRLLSPGLMLKHYAPNLPVYLNAKTVHSHQALLTFGSQMIVGAKKVFNLSQKGCLVEAAHNLYHMLQEADKSGCSSIAVVEIPNHGIGEAINDRLCRAAYKDEREK